MGLQDYTQRNDPVLPTGSLQLDLSLARGGLLPGEVVLIHGPQECGKTLLALKMLIEAGDAGKNGIMIDADLGLEADFAIRYGADLDRLFLSQAVEPGKILAFTESILQKKVYSMVVIDSVTDYMDETVEGFEKNQQALAAHLPRLVRLAKETGTVLVFTEHTNPWERRVYHQLARRLEKISLSLHAGIRLELQPDQAEPAGDLPGIWVRITILKGKKPGINIPIRLNLLYNHRIAKCAELLDLGLQSGAIQIKENAFAFGNRLLGSDHQKTIFFLSQNPAVTEIIEQDIRNWFVLRSGLV